MRTVIAPLEPEVAAQLEALDEQAARVSGQFISRLAFQPHLGEPIGRGLLSAYGVRRVRFDRASRPERLLEDPRGRVRRGDEDPSQGPALRVIYRLREARRSDVLLVQVLAVGYGHKRLVGGADAYEDATRLLRRLLDDENRRKR